MSAVATASAPAGSATAGAAAAAAAPAPAGFTVVATNHRQLIQKMLAKYSQPFTPIREGVQNADDAGATHIRIHLQLEYNQEPQQTAKKSPASAAAASAQPQRNAAAGAVAATVEASHSCFDASSLSPHVEGATLRSICLSNDGAAFTPTCFERVQTIAQGNPNSAKVGMFGVGFFSNFEYSDCPTIVSGDHQVEFHLGEMSCSTKMSGLSAADRIKYAAIMGSEAAGEATTGAGAAAKRIAGTDPNFTFIHLPLKHRWVVSSRQHCAEERMEGREATGSEGKIAKSQHVFWLPNFLSYCSQLLSSAKNVRRLQVYQNKELMCDLSKSLAPVAAASMRDLPDAGEATLVPVQWDESVCTVSARVYEAPTAPLTCHRFTASFLLHQVTADVRLAEAERQRMAATLGKDEFMRRTQVLLSLPLKQTQQTRERLLIDVLPYVNTREGGSCLESGWTHNGGSDAALEAQIAADFPSPVPFIPRGFIHVGSSTQQPTSGSFHFNAQLYPTIERVQLDLSEGPLGMWNMTVLKFVGRLMRHLYETECARAEESTQGEVAASFAAMAASTAASSSSSSTSSLHAEVTRESWNRVLSFLLLGNFSNDSSTPWSSRLVSAGFFSAGSLRLPVVDHARRVLALSTRTFTAPSPHLESLLRLPVCPAQIESQLGAFLRSIKPTANAAHAGGNEGSPAATAAAGSAPASVYAQHAMVQLTCSRIQTALRGCVLSEAEVISVLKYLILSTKTANPKERAPPTPSEATTTLTLTSEQVKSLLQASKFSIPPDRVFGKHCLNTSELRLDQIKQYSNSTPHDLPLPATCLPLAISTHFLADELERVFQWTKLTEQMWLDRFLTQGVVYTASCPCFATPQTALPVLHFLSNSLASFTQAKRNALAVFLRYQQCLPAVAGGWAQLTSTEQQSGSPRVIMSLPSAVFLPPLISGSPPGHLLLPAMQVDMGSKPLDPAVVASLMDTSTGNDSDAFIEVDDENEGEESKESPPQTGTSSAVAAASAMSVSCHFLHSLGCQPIPVAELLLHSGAGNDIAPDTRESNIQLVQLVLHQQDGTDLAQFRTERHLIGVDAGCLNPATITPATAKSIKYFAQELVFPAVAATLGFPPGLLVLDWPSSAASQLRDGQAEYSKLKAMGVRETPRLEFLLALCASSPSNEVGTALAYLIEHFDPHYRKSFPLVMQSWTAPFLPCATPTLRGPRTRNTVNSILHSAAAAATARRKAPEQPSSAAYRRSGERSAARTALPDDQNQSNVSRACHAALSLVRAAPVAADASQLTELCLPNKCFLSASPLFPSLLPSVVAALARHQLEGGALAVHDQPAVEHAMLWMMMYASPSPENAVRLFEYFHTLPPPSHSFARALRLHNVKFVPVPRPDGGFALASMDQVFVSEVEDEPDEVAEVVEIDGEERKESVSCAASSAVATQTSRKRSRAASSTVASSGSKSKKTSRSSTSLLAASKSKLDFSRFPGLVSFVNFSESSNAFLLQLGVLTQPTALQLLRCLADKAVRWFQQAAASIDGNEMQAKRRIYARYLNHINACWTSCSAAETKQMKEIAQNMCLLATRHSTPTEPSEEKSQSAPAAKAIPTRGRSAASSLGPNPRRSLSSRSSSRSSSSVVALGEFQNQEFALVRGSDVFLLGSSVDRCLALQLNPWCCPSNCALGEEKWLYQASGAQWLSKAVRIDPVIGVAMRADTNEIRERLRARLPLLVRPQRGDKEIGYSHAKWDLIRQADFRVQLVRTLAHQVGFGSAPVSQMENYRSVALVAASLATSKSPTHNQVSKESASSSSGSAAGSPSTSVTLFFRSLSSTAVTLDWYDLALELADFLEVDSKGMLATLWESLLSASEAQLKRRGFLPQSEAGEDGAEMLQWSKLAKVQPVPLLDFGMGESDVLGSLTLAHAYASSSFNEAVTSGDAPDKLSSCTGLSVQQLDEEKDLAVAADMRGMRLFLDKAIRSEVLANEGGRPAMKAFTELIQDLLHHVFAVPPDRRSGYIIYYDVGGAAQGFNFGGSVFLNLRFWRQRHWQLLQRAAAHSPKALFDACNKAAASWMNTIAHELAHRRVMSHGAQHTSIMSALMEECAQAWAVYATRVLPNRVKTLAGQARGEAIAGSEL